MATQTVLVSQARTDRQPGTRPGAGFELYMWFFTRVSGVLFLLLAAFSLVYANLMGGQGGAMHAGAQIRWAFFPISFHVSNASVELTPNFANPFWQFYSFLIIAIAATHGANGLRMILTDYIRHPLLLSWVKALLFGVWLLALMAAIYLIWPAQGG